MCRHIMLTYLPNISLNHIDIKTSVLTKHIVIFLFLLQRLLTACLFKLTKSVLNITTVPCTSHMLLYLLDTSSSWVRARTIFSLSLIWIYSFYIHKYYMAMPCFLHNNKISKCHKYRSHSIDNETCVSICTRTRRICVICALTRFLKQKEWGLPTRYII